MADSTRTVRRVAIRLGPSDDTKIEFDGEQQREIESFVVQQRAGDPMARIDVVRLVTVAEAERRGITPHPYSGYEADSLPRVVETVDSGVADIEIDGLADVIELFEIEARKAAAEQRLALGSFVVRDGEPGTPLYTLGEIIADAKRYRALGMWLDDISTSIRIAGSGRNTVCVNVGELDDAADELRQRFGILAQRETPDDTERADPADPADPQPEPTP